MAGYQYGGSGPRGYPRTRTDAGYGRSAGFPKEATGWKALDAADRAWRSPMGTPSSGRINPLLELEARVLGDAALPRGVTLNRMGSMLPAAPRVPWDTPAASMGRGLVPRALRGALLPLNAALLALDIWNLWAKASAWWNHPDPGGYDPAAAGFILDCMSSAGGFPSQEGALCGFGIYVPENWVQVPVIPLITPTSPHLNLNTRTNTLGEAPGAYYVGSKSNWHWDFSANPVADFEVVGNTTAAMMLGQADPALDYGSKARDVWGQETISQTNRRAGYAAPLGYALTDPLIAVSERTSAWWRQFPEYAGNTYTYPDVAGQYGNRPPIKSRPVRNNYRKPFNQQVKLRRTKERKAGGLGRILLAELVTEGCDFVKAVFEALPEFRQRQARYPDNPARAADPSRRYTGRRVVGSDGKKTRAKQASVEDKFGRPTTKPPTVGCQNMAQAIWNYADEIDIDKAMGNVVKQGLEDLALGKLSSKAAKAFGKANLGLGNTSPRGPGWGPAL